VFHVEHLYLADLRARLAVASILQARALVMQAQQNDDAKNDGG
jgi:hypothetical protein